LAALFLCGPDLAVAAEAGGVGRAVIVRGSASVARASGESASLVAGEWLVQGDTVEVGDGSFVRLLMKDESLLDLGARSRITLSVYDYSRIEKRRKASIRVFLGRVWARVAKAFAGDPSYVINGENAVAGVRGTELVFDVAEDGTATLTVVEGSVALTSKLTGASELFGALTRGLVGADGVIQRRAVTAEEIAKMRAGQKAKPSLDDGDVDARLGSARERLGVEVTPESPVPIVPPDPDPDPDEPLEDPFENLDDRKDDPAEPLIDFEPDGGTVKVRGSVEVIEP
jgi:hypothetical protein